MKKKRGLSQKTAQIYKDCMYIYAHKANAEYDEYDENDDDGQDGHMHSVDELWSFDLKNRTWTLCATTGEAPPGLTRTPNSFIIGNKFYIYGGWKNDSSLRNLFMLNLNSMKWTNIGPGEKDPEFEAEGDEENYKRWNDPIYEDHLVTLEKLKNSEENVLSFLNLRTKNTSSAFSTQGFCKSYWPPSSISGHLMKYRNWVLNLATEFSGLSRTDLIVAMINIENFGICSSKSAKEEEDQSGLFLSQNKSDVAFKVQDQLIPAHKQVLGKKSEYFDSLFESGMVESTRNIIEVKDYEYELFKEYMRWLYQGTVNIQDANQAMELFILAGRYLQEDLREKCLDILTSIINMDNVITTFNFASQENDRYIKSWCLKCIQDKLNIHNVAGFIQDLKKLKENNKKFKDQAFLFILDNLFELYENEKGEMQIYEDFIIENIEINTIPALAHFLGCSPKKQRETFENQFDYKYECDPEDEEEEMEIEIEDEDEQEDDSEGESEEEMKAKKAPISKDLFEKCTAHLKEAVFSFVQEKAQMIMKNKMWQDFPKKFTGDLFLHTNENLGSIKTENQVLRNGRKRMGPSQNDFNEEEGHELKKTKKSEASE